MKISTSSWHYRLLDWTYDDSVPQNLCPYVDKLVLAILIAPLTALWKAASKNGKIVILISGTGLALGIEFALFGVPLWFSLIIWQITVWGMAGILYVLSNAILYLSEKFPRKYKHVPSHYNSESTPKPPKPPSLVVEWLKAKHERICPRLEFE